MALRIVKANIDSRYSFTAQFLRGASIFAKRAHELEENFKSFEIDKAISEHRAFVVAAIVQSSAALEAEISEIARFGPGHHLGSNGVDVFARDLLKPIADIIDEQQALERYQIVLHLLGKKKFDRGKQPFQSVALLVRLRNELVHYKSRYGREMDSMKLFQSLARLKHSRPPFISSSANFFPHQCLNADCAKWSVRSAVGFIDSFYERLNFHNPLDSQRSEILQLLN